MGFHIWLSFHIPLVRVMLGHSHTFFTCILRPVILCTVTRISLDRFAVWFPKEYLRWLLRIQPPYTCGEVRLRVERVVIMGKNSGVLGDRNRGRRYRSALNGRHGNGVVLSEAPWCWLSLQGEYLWRYPTLGTDYSTVPKKTGKISIVFEDLSKKSVIFGTEVKP